MNANITLLAALLCFYCAICSHAAFLSRFGKRYQSERPQVTLPRFGKRPSYQLAQDALSEIVPIDQAEASEVGQVYFQPALMASPLDRAKEFVPPGDKPQQRLDGRAE